MGRIGTAQNACFHEHCAGRQTKTEPIDCVALHVCAACVPSAERSHDDGDGDGAVRAGSFVDIAQTNCNWLTRF